MFLTETTGLCTIWRYHSLHIVVIMIASLPDLLPFLVIGGFALFAAVRHAWQFLVLPRRIPPEEIKLLVDELISQYGEGAAEVAFLREDRAWRYSDSVEQGKWRRVGAEFDRRDRFRGTIR